MFDVIRTHPPVPVGQRRGAALALLGSERHDPDIQQQQTFLNGRSVTMVTTVNRKRLNPGVAKHQKWAFFQTVNHSKIVWDPKAKPKGLLGGQWAFKYKKHHVKNRRT